MYAGTIYLVAGPGGPGYTYQFLLNGRDIAGATGQTYTTTVTNNGTYSVRVTDAFGCSATSSSVVVRVTANDIVSLTAGSSTVFCQGGSVLLSTSVSGNANNYTYQFTRNGVEIPGATSAAYSVTTSGSYAVVVYNPNTCSETSNTIPVTVNPITVPTLSYGSSSYCQSGTTTPVPAASPTGGTFTATPGGLSLGSTTGAINLAQSQPGTYTVTYTAGSPCPGSASATVVITAPPTAGFSYAAATGCAGTSGTLAATLAGGATAGSFTASPAGLSLNASTGAIDLSQSQAGTYTVTNTVGAASGCSPVTATARVTLTAQPVATLAAGGPTTFCQGGAVLLTAGGGTTGSTYQFLLNGQPIAGATAATYSATASGAYSVLISNGGSCTSTSTAVSVTMNPLTTATFTYPAAAYCQNAGSVITPTITGTAGGTFAASPAGLALDAGSGAVNPGQSRPGTYTITYSVSGPCPSTSTQLLTITAPAVATFSYGAAIYCAGSASPTATLAAGATAGIFTASPAGLVVNASTGAIDLTQSQPGAYTITNTVAAAGGCPAATATAQVSISPVPVPTLAASGPTTFCQGGAVLLTANGGAAGATYQFLLNGQPISGATAATYAATASGAYSVTITNGGSCAATSAATSITVNPIATPTLTYSASSFCQGAGTASATVAGGASGGTFTASPAGLSLNASTGAINLGQSQPGTYAITYVGGSPCPGSTTTSVTILATPSAAFSYAQGSTFCTSGASATPTITGAAGGTFAATPAGLSIDPATGTLNLSTSTAGTYAVTYTVAGPCPASTTLALTVTAAPVATFSYPGAAGYCAGTTGTVAPTYAGGGSAGLFSAAPAGLALNASSGAVDLSQSQPGTYTVTNTIGASGACAAVSATASLTINAAPMATLTAGGPTTFCAGGAVVLTATGGGTYQFLLNGQPISGATAATYAATASGLYTVSVSNASGCTSTSAAVAVTVNPATTATFSYPATGFCQSGTPVTPTITGTAGGTFSAPAGLTINATTGAITPATSASGTYTVTYSVAGPCASTGTASVTITAPATAAFSYAQASYCATGTAPATLGSGSTAGTYSASPAGLSLNPSTGAVNLGASQAGTYTIANTVAAGGGCAAITSTTTLTINALPAQPVLTLTGSTLSTPVVPGASYQFYRNGTLLPGTTGPSISVTQNGSYTVVVTSAAGCTSPASAAVTVGVTATVGSQATLDLTIYPNPTPDGQLRLDLPAQTHATQLTVLNTLGQPVYTTTLAAGTTTTSLDLHSLATGVYLLRATTPDGTSTRRLIRQ
ncbi:T9SS type A sorting domain-containing protein [Hymenobacter sp. BRD67]|uniref:T9SS type A sorting domain-containing protein n=1 Tax=Hymenobacter sp. BRD67 TaxID=2675877 RepID=UPI001563811E|nr:T9SS type A sorting domain-containing protein [Hymenobacter sp. BRD67]QKG54561.1 T9SS type A sorting domain-containing protein [Hymenobacter sp. BRD67]